MKKITLFLLTVFVCTISWSQCTNGGAYQGAILANDGSWEQQSGCNYTAEYSNTTGVIDGHIYSFRSEIATDYITVTSSDGNIIYGHGVTPLTLVIDTSADLNDQALRVYYHNDAACGGTNSCRVTEVRNDIVAADLCPGPVNFAASNITDTTADLIWNEDGVVALSYSVEVYLTGESAVGGNTPLFVDLGVSGTTVLATGLSESTDYDAYIITTCSGATTTSALIGPLTFTTTAACADVSGIGIDNLTYNSVDIVWTQGNGNDSYLVEVYASGESASNGDTPLYANGSSTSSPESVTGLSASTDYDAYVTGLCGATATNVQGPESFTTPPANDEFSNAMSIDCISGAIMGSTFYATLDEGDAPDGGGADMDAPNVWYALDSTIDGASDVTLDLCGSSYDTSVLIYTGTSGNLNFIAGNDDNEAACGQCCQSLVTFPTDGSSIYYIAVEGYDPGSRGDFEMVVTCTPATPAPGNDECANAEALTTGIPTSGTTVGATTSPGESPVCDEFGSIADVWYSYQVTGGTSNLSITTTITGTSDQANIAVYNDCTALVANSLGCANGGGGETLEVFNLAENGTYYIRVWSDGNAPSRGEARTEGTFNIVVNATLSSVDIEDNTALNYYPNPVENSLTLNAHSSIKAINVYNMLGQKVLGFSPNDLESVIDMSNLQSGTYFVKVNIDNVIKTIRVIKQ